MMRTAGLTLALTAALLGPTPAEAAPCDVSGAVLDERGEPMGGVDVELDDGASPRHTTTDSEGGFHFATVPSATMVRLSLKDPGDSPRFQFVLPAGTPKIEAAIDPDAGQCEVVLRPSDDPSQRAQAALLRGVHHGFELFDRLGIRPQAPLRVEMFDAIASPDAAYWVGPRSFNPDATQDARLILGTAASRADEPGQPDNREYHELGHHALASAFGALPQSREHIENGGYHLNAGSSAAWSEGFAIFFAAMVAREIDKRPDASRYRVGGAWLDLEFDYRPWDLRGTESVAVAGLLWDLVDQDRPAVASSLEVRELRVSKADDGMTLLVGSVRNGSTTTVTDPRVRAQHEAWTGTGVVVPASLEPDAVGQFAIPLPEATASASASDFEVQAGTDLGATDDDPVHVPLAEVWAAITEFRSERDQSNGRLFDVADLYQALRGRVDSSAVDALFIAHGLYADTNGNRTHDAGEVLGLTSHPSQTVEIEGTPTTWPAFDPRYRLALPAALRLSATTEPTEATLVVAHPSSSWGGYIARPDDKGVVLLVPPPARPQHDATVLALSEGFEPGVVVTQPAVELLAEVERHDDRYLSAAVTLDRARSVGGGSAASNLRWLFVGGLGAVVLGLLFVGLGWPRRR